MGQMDPDAYLTSLRADRTRLAALADADLSAMVPACPDWDVSELLTHLGRVHRWAMDSAELSPAADFPRFGPRPDPDESIIDWLVGGLDELIAYLASTDLDAPCWSFTGPTTRRFWIRRQCHETAIHRWDAQDAVGQPDPVEGSLAVDGLDEWLEIESRRWFKGDPAVSGTIHLHATDGEGEWHIEVDPSRLHWQHGHHKGDAAVRGSRSDLLLVAWRRISPERVDLLGDVGLIERFLDQTQVS
jgi:uncharacterized protein (TIGR03083 family)